MEDDKSQLSLRLQERCGERGEMLEVDGQMVWNKAVPLPTPEERMRQAAQAVPTDIVPINVTGIPPIKTHPANLSPLASTHIHVLKTEKF